jgi:hypothetical protein
MIPDWYGDAYTVAPEILPGVHAPVTATIKTVVAIWAVEAALLLGILLTVATAFHRVKRAFRGGFEGGRRRRAAGGDEYRVRIRFRRRDRRAAGLHRRRDALKSIPDPLVNAAVSVSSLAGITGSASGGMSIALAAMSDLFIQGAKRPRFRSRCCTAWWRWPAAAWTRCRTTAPSSRCWR